MFDSVLESRFTVGGVPATAALLTIATDRVCVAATAWPVLLGGRDLPIRLLWLGTLAAVLLPLTPTPFDTVDRRPPTGVLHRRRLAVLCRPWWNPGDRSVAQPREQ